MKRILLCFLIAGCNATTGGHRFTFNAAAAGSADLPGGPISFQTAAGWTVNLTRAVIHIGALYLNQTVFGGGPEMALGCYSSSTYSGEVLGALDVDALNPNPQPFPVQGNGIDLEAKSAEVWLNGGVIDAPDDPTIILDIAGTATNAAQTIPFQGGLTIGQNRTIPTQNPALPGLNPICQQRIVRPIVFDVTLSQGGTLLVRIDPRQLFGAADFSTLMQASITPPLWQFPDCSGTNCAGRGSQAEQLVYDGLRSASGTYSFEWTP